MEKRARLHPLALLQITDHITRLHSVAAKPASHAAWLCFGALLGEHQGTAVDLQTACEVRCVAEDGLTSPRLDVDHVQHQCQLLKEVMPQLDLLGWYAIPVPANRVEPRHSIPSTLEAMHAQMRRLVGDSAILLIMDPLPAAGTLAMGPQIPDPELPVHLLEWTPTCPRGLSVPYTVVSGETERIAVEQVVQSHDEHGNLSRVQHFLDSQKMGVAALAHRIHTLRLYLESVRLGQTPVDWTLLTDIHALLSQLPDGGSDTGMTSWVPDQLLDQEYGTCMLTCVSAGLTRSLGQLEECKRLLSLHRHTAAAHTALSGNLSRPRPL